MTLRLLLVGLLVGLAPSIARATSGGPDAFGYTWTDEVDPAIGFTTTAPIDLDLNGEQVSAPIDLGFSFPYYGNSYTRFVVSSNGWLSFDTSLTNPHPVPQALPVSSAPNLTVAWFWRDLDATHVPAFSHHGPIAGGYKVRVVTQVPGGDPDSVVVTMALYQSGMIKVSYDAIVLPETASIGIENAAGNIGLNPSYLGTGENGFVLSSGKAVAYYPPPKLSCASPGTIACGQTLTFSSPATVTPNVTDYTCSTSAYLGRERVIAFNNPGLGDVQISLTRQPNGADMDVFLLRQGMCNEFQCMTGGADVLNTAYLGKGDYYIVVDGKKAADNGSFDLKVDCTPRSAVLNCQAPSDPPRRGNTTGSSGWDIYPCSNKFFDGPEFIYEIPFTAPGNVKVTLTPDPNVLLDVLAFGPDNFNAPEGCIGWADNNLTLFNPASGTYYLVVDGYSDPNDPTQQNSGGFGIKVTCDIQLDCSAPVGALQCFQTTSGSTVGATNKAETYSCNGTPFTGPEVVYTFHNDTQRTVAFKWTGPPDLGLFLIGSGGCNEGACLRFGNGRLVARDLPVGDYHVVVDGKNGAAGSFTLKPICGNKVDPPVGSWKLDPAVVVHETKALTVTGEPTYGDIMFSIDDTGSMGGAIANLQTTTQEIINQLSAQVDDVSFGLSTLEDYPNPTGTGGCTSQSYGSGSDRPYRLNLPLTNNLAELFAVIQTLAARGGGDGPESYLHSYFEMYADAANIGWRPGARQIVVMMGDNDIHSCDAFACTRSRTPNGPELGPDSTRNTADDIEVLPLMAELKRRGITPLFLQTSGDPNLLANWDCWTSAGGGKAYDSPQGVLPGGIIQDMRRTIESRTLICYDLVVATTPGFEAWVTNLVPPAMQNVYLPAEVNFDFDVGPPAGTTPGIYNFEIEFLCDGEVKAKQSVSIEVPGVCTPNVAVNLSGATCPGDARVLDASTSVINGCPGTLEWQWKDALGSVVQPWSGTGSTLNVNPRASTQYTVEIRCTDQAACPIIGSRLQVVNVDAEPGADAGPDAAVCLTESVLLGSPAVALRTYSWSPSTELDDPSLAQPTFSTGATSPTGPRVYTLTVTDSATGCTSTDTVTVGVSDGAPVGVIGNHLHAVKQLADVDLQWRTSPLSIRTYNMHRETSKLNLAPPASPAIGSAVGDEIYTDAGAVPAPALFFYEVYGRDCAGNSIFN